MLTLLYTNDLHGCVGMLPRLATLIARERARDPSALLVDAGDVSFGGLTTELSSRLLASLGYDAITPGNAENDLPECRTHLARIGAPVLVANVAPGAMGYPTVPCLIHARGGLRVALLGLTTPLAYPPGHPLHRARDQAVTVDDPVAAARHWVPRLRRQADLMVVVSHLGLRSDIRLAQAVPGIDLIIGGHSHHRLPALLQVGSTRITQAGVGGGYLGIVEIDGSAGALRYTSRLEPVWQAAADDPAMVATIQAYLAAQRPAALAQVGVSSGCWADPWYENRWANFVTDSLRAAADADVCFYNAHAIRPALQPGPLNVWDLERCLPGMPMNEAMGLDDVVALTVTGAAMRAICEHSVSQLACDLAPDIQPPVCWPANNLLHASGMRVAFDLSRPLGQRVVDLRIGSAPLCAERRYRVVIPGFLARGYAGYRWFKEPDERRQVGQERSLLLAALRAGRPLPECEGRLRFR